MAERAPAGIVVVDKPEGWTSHDVVARVRRLAGTRKVGHAGTLDPMATGVLVLGVESATRLLTFVVGADKDYSATIRLGVVTTTDDAQGEVLERAGAAIPLPDLADHVARLTGAIDQVPSAVSAIKVDGRRAYARVRAGETVELAARPVTVHRLQVQDVRPGVAEDTPVVDVDVDVTCSSGTYVRAIARDLGAALGTGGHLTALRRTRVGGYGIDQARTLDELAEELSLLPLAEAARATLPSRSLDAELARELSFGRRIPTTQDGPVGTRELPVAAFGPEGELVALLTDEQGRSRPVIVFARPDETPGATP
ncbi:tRNA pseudouridine(55) synthase TruB [Actinotalea sp. C106]|uniref:tRNA pseudouridine(55) synthase TruB n=1 Tax=Actinotalea sp. C106 TaxID=2908644 RepID=UPI0020282DEA|nr:tRNA pseudouridine(55) synthase TruB [Actinotalea sp. C106]